jgi:hypothetical protein
MSKEVSTTLAKHGAADLIWMQRENGFRLWSKSCFDLMEDSNGLEAVVLQETKS